MPAVIGVTLAKINGIFDVWVKGSKWSIKRPVNQIPTGGGIVESVGLEMITGSFDEVIPTAGAVNWRALVDFTVQIYDQPTQKIQIVAAEGCNWESIDGSSDIASAMLAKAISWKGTKVAGML